MAASAGAGARGDSLDQLVLFKVLEVVEVVHVRQLVFDLALQAAVDGLGEGLAGLEEGVVGSLDLVEVARVHRLFCIRDGLTDARVVLGRECVGEL